MAISVENRSDNAREDYGKYIKLVLVLPLFVYLIAVFPYAIRPAYENDIALNPSVESFLWLSFFVDFFAVALLSFAIINFSKDFVVKHATKILFFSSFFYSCYRIFKTFDVTDTGFHVTKAFGLLSGDIAQNIDLIVGFNLIHGLWLKIIGIPSLLWARLGYVILVSLIIWLSYKIYRLYFDQFHHFWIFFSLIFYFIHYNYYLSVNYDNLPVAFLLAGAFFLLRNDLASFRDIFIGGLMFAMAIFTKLNTIFIVSTIPLVGYYLYQRKDCFIKKKVAAMTAGYLSVLAFCILILLITNTHRTFLSMINTEILSRIFSSDAQSENNLDLMKMVASAQENNVFSLELLEPEIASGSNKLADNQLDYLPEHLKNDPMRQSMAYRNFKRDSHNFSSLLSTYYFHSRQILSYGAEHLLYLSVIIFVLSNVVKHKIPFFLVISAVSLHLFYGPYSNVIIARGQDLFYVCSLILCAHILFYLFNRNEKLFFPLTLLSLLAMFSFPGSDLSVNVIMRSGIGLIILAFPLAFLYDFTADYGQYKINTRCFTLIITGFIVLTSIFPRDYHISYRDIQDRSVLITMFKSPQLFGIHSSVVRTVVVDELLQFFANENYQKNTTPAVFLGWLPMMYYLTQTSCITKNPWHAMEEEFDRFVAEFEQSAEKSVPIYITFNKSHTRLDSWPTNNRKAEMESALWAYDLRQQDYIKYRWMPGRNYKMVFENHMFEVWKLNTPPIVQNK